MNDGLLKNICKITVGALAAVGACVLASAYVAGQNSTHPACCNGCDGCDDEIEGAYQEGFEDGYAAGCSEECEGCDGCPGCPGCIEEEAEEGEKESGEEDGADYE